MDFYQINKHVAKDLFIRLLFGGSYQTWLNDNLLDEKIDFVIDFENEIKDLIEIVYAHNQHIEKDVLRFDKQKYNSVYEAKCSVMSLWAQTLERQVQETAIASLGFNLEDIVPCQDGFMILKKLFYPTICEDLNKAVFDKLGMSLNWKIKPFDEAIFIRRVKSSKDLLAEDKQNKHDMEMVDELARYTQWKDEFEKNHCKIIDKSLYVKHERDVVFLSGSQFATSYNHIKDVKRWVLDPSMKTYENVGIYPKECPSNMFNLWKPFPFEDKQSSASFKILQYHLLVLCNNDIMVFRYIEKWLAQMVQYPEVKTICPTFISKQGSGKGRWLDICRRILGSKKVMETGEPERDVWGHFNGQMSSAFLINLNELSKKCTKDSMGVIKRLITDPTITINNKGVNQIEIASFHRFLITTNCEDPIQTSEDDRRNLIIRCSDELIGNKTYFEILQRSIEDDDIVCAYFNYLKSIPDMDKFNRLKIPKTEYQTDLKEVHLPVVNQWVKSLMIFNNADFEMSSKDAYRDFKTWLNDNFPKYDPPSQVSFGLKIKNCGLGVTNKHTKNGNVYIFKWVR